MFDCAMFSWDVPEYFLHPQRVIHSSDIDLYQYLHVFTDTLMSQDNIYT